MEKKKQDKLKILAAGDIHGDIGLAEKLAEYLDNDELRFIAAYHKKDSEKVIKYFVLIRIAS